MAFLSSSQLAISNTATAAVPVPSGAAADDVAVVGLYIESTTAVTPPSGFTQKDSDTTNAGTEGGLRVYWKRLTGADSGTWDFTFSTSWAGAAAVLHRGRITTGDPFDGTNIARSTATVSTSPAVAVTPAEASGDAVWFATDFSGGNTWTPPGSYTERQDNDVITVATRDAISAGATGNITGTLNVAGYSKAWLGVVRVPATGPAIVRPTAADALAGYRRGRRHH